MTTPYPGMSASGDHGTLTGLSDDDHSQYALLAGRSGGQTLNGDTSSSGTLTLNSTVHATKGKIFIGANSVYDQANDSLGVDTTAPASKVNIAGNQSAAAWATDGIRLVLEAGTLTDTTSTGLVSVAYTNRFGRDTIAASSATTFSNYYGTYFTQPDAGTNVTFTNKWAIGGDSLRVGTSNHLTVSAAGAVSAFSLACPTFTTASGAMTVTPAAGSSLNVALSTTGNFAVNTTELVVDTGVGVGIGTASPTRLLHVETGTTGVTAANSTPDVLLSRLKYVTSPGNAPNKFVFYDNLSTITYGVGMSDTTGFDLFAGNRGFNFLTGCSNVDGTGATSRMLISNAGDVGIGTTSPTAKAHVDQSSTTAAIPVLTLDQADISEEMIEFVTTIGTGNAIEAVGAKTLTTTHFIKVTLPGSLTRYIPCGTIA